VDLDDETLAVLRAHRNREDAPPTGDGDRVFCHNDGTRIDIDVVTRRFRKAVKRSGVLRIRLHDVRHTRGCLLAEAGVDVRYIAQQLGDSLETVQSTCLDHAPKTRPAAVAAIGALMDRPQLRVVEEVAS